MASLDQLETALRNADAAGDAEAAKALAGEIIKMRGTAQPQSVMDKLTGTNGPRYQTWPEKALRGLVGAATDAAKLPGDVYTGKTKMELPTVSDDPTSPDFVGNAGPSGNVMNDAVIPRAMNFATMATPVNPAVRAGDRAIPGVAGAATEKVKPPVPSAQELKAAGGADIQAAKNSGLEVTASSVGDWSRKVQQELFDSGVHPTLAGNTHKILKELEDAPPGSFSTAANLQSLRETLQSVAQNFNADAAKDQLAASRAIKSLDEFIPNLNPKDILAGTAAATQKMFETGRGNYAAAFRSNDLTGKLDRAKTGILERAEGRAQAANSGRNLDNSIRSRVESLLERPKEVSGFSDKELEALNSVVAGGPVRNSSRYISGWLGGGGGIGQSSAAAIGAAAGASVGGVPGAFIGAAAPTVAGSALKSVANALAKRDLARADELVRMRSPLYKEALKAADTMPAHLGKKAAIAKLLLMDALQGKQ